MATSHGGAGRGQGRTLDPKTLDTIIGRLRRAIDRLEASGKQPDPALVLAAVNLDIQAGRLLRLAKMERPAPLTEDERVRSEAAASALEAEWDSED